MHNKRTWVLSNLGSLRSPWLILLAMWGIEEVGNIPSSALSMPPLHGLITTMVEVQRELSELVVGVQGLRVNEQHESAPSEVAILYRSCCCIPEVHQQDAVDHQQCAYCIRIKRNLFFSIGGFSLPPPPPNLRVDFAFLHLNDYNFATMR